MGKLVLSEHQRNPHFKHEVFGSLRYLRGCCLCCRARHLPQWCRCPRQDPEVIAAEAAHFAAKGVYAGYPYGYAGWNGYYNGWAGYNGAWNGYYGYPHGALVAYANGAVAPAKTPEVVAAE